MFDLYDANNSGTISMREMSDLVMCARAGSPIEQDLLSLLRSARHKAEAVEGARAGVHTRGRVHGRADSWSTTRHTARTSTELDLSDYMDSLRTQSQVTTPARQAQASECPADAPIAALRARTGTARPHWQCVPAL